MEFFEEWVAFIILIGTLILTGGGVYFMLCKTAKKAIKKHEKETLPLCGLHSNELKSINDTNKIMLETQDVTLSALEKLVDETDINGDIKEQRKKLKDHILEQFSNRQ